MGGDQGPRLVVPAVVESLRRFPRLKCELHGDSAEIERRLGVDGELFRSRLTIVHADQMVAMADKPSNALRHARQSSLWQALESLGQGRVDGCVSAGNTGALMMMSVKLVGTLEGIERPAICTSMPTRTGKAYLLDMGANLHCSADQLLQFAHMATAMVAEVESIPRPRVGLLNVGSEAGKGDAVVQEAARKFQDDELVNYCGFVEGNTIFSGDFDIVVCDGFVGNVALKTAEGVAQLIVGMLKSELSDSLRAKIGALIARPALINLQSQLDPANYNGAKLLGLKKTVVKSHGGANQAGFLHAIAVAVREVENNVPARIAEKLKSFANIGFQPAER